SRWASRAGFFLVGIHAPLLHVMPEHKIYDTPAGAGQGLAGEICGELKIAIAGKLAPTGLR
ncbi:hypothetical protein, partial [Pseudomonas sp. NPDC099000]|uniref:hypothetical protein n=1 Tax=Pseudomonas sp. NPDC099000 TaxID=3364488 RepID=UPI00383BC216